jgi:hypothetical protein
MDTKPDTDDDCESEDPWTSARQTVCVDTQNFVLPGSLMRSKLPMPTTSRTFRGIIYSSKPNYGSSEYSQTDIFGSIQQLVITVLQHGSAEL